VEKKGREKSCKNNQVNDLSPLLIRGVREKDAARCSIAANEKHESIREQDNSKVRPHRPFEAGLFMLDGALPKKAE
jgi:hypothetical protein